MRIFTSTAVVLFRVMGLLLAIYSLNYYLATISLITLSTLAVTGKIKNTLRIVIEAIAFAVAIAGYYYNTYYELPSYLITLFIIFGIAYYGLAIFSAYYLKNN